MLNRDVLGTRTVESIVANTSVQQRIYRSFSTTYSLLFKACQFPHLPLQRHTACYICSTHRSLPNQCLCERVRHANVNIATILKIKRFGSYSFFVHLRPMFSMYHLMVHQGPGSMIHVQPLRNRESLLKRLVAFKRQESSSTKRISRFFDRSFEPCAPQTVTFYHSETRRVVPCILESANICFDLLDRSSLLVFLLLHDILSLSIFTL